MTNESIDVVQEVSQNFIDFSYDTNTNRAFPDARDGLKPGQRCILWEMYTKGYSSKKPHVKSAKVDGGVAANWWPHGIQAIYETFVHMSQPFTNNNPEIDFHGANGNVVLGSDAFAADRYTEVRLSKISEQGLLDGISKNAVDMMLNFSEDEEMPTVLPAIFPRLLVNGSQGIGVSVANVWTLHNFQETANLLVNYLKTSEVENDSYYPDFPTGCTIINKNELGKINQTGKGRIILEARYELVGKKIHFTEFPYQVYIEPVIEEIKKAYEEGKLDGFADCSNRTDKKRTLLVVEATSAAKVQTLLEELFQYTSLRTQINVNQMAVVSKTPTLLSLEDICRIYKEHNLSCIKRAYQFDLDKTLDRIEILEGLERAYNGIDNVIKLIRSSKSAADAKAYMTDKLGLTERQADAILALKLSRLAHLEKQEILDELAAKRELAKKLQTIVESEEEQKNILIEKLVVLAKEFGSPRRTQVINKEIQKKSPKEKQKELPHSVIICLDKNGYVKSVPVAKFRTSPNNVREEKVENNELVVFYSSLGRAFRVKASSFKECLNSDKGTALGTILDFQLQERIVTFTTPRCDDSVMIVTSDGYSKRVKSSDLNGVTQNLKGMPIIKLHDAAEVVSVQCCEDYECLELTTTKKQLLLNIDDIPTLTKASPGRKTMKLAANDKIEYAVLTTKGNKVCGKMGGAGKNIG